MAYLLSAMKEFTPTGNMGPPASVNPSQKACQLDKIITRMQGLKRKLEVLRKEEKGILEHSKRRITHLQELHDAPSLVDEGYDQWGRVCLDRLLVDYLSRNGYEKSAKQLAGDLGIEDLVDVNVFVHCARIEASLRKGSVVECLVWCAENKNQLRNIKVFLHAFWVLTKADFCDFGGRVIWSLS